MLALLVPAPTSFPASTRTQVAPRRVSSRAIAEPTTPAPTTATSKGPDASGPLRSAPEGGFRCRSGLCVALSPTAGQVIPRRLTFVERPE